jgi:hypothetical protein
MENIWTEEEVAGGRRKSDNDELLNFYLSPNTIRTIK